ncbi:hypothetical protein [Winogradskyella tangerina]|uniref:hypothetical protein n=1 Tax=Winogradskyella tangerina TaxID=2023240 RepID=UPI000DBE202D|nr:hypothetical protein [Winogradskyella tangerina]
MKNQRTKNIVLVGSFILVVFIAYKCAFSNTYIIKQELQMLQKEASVFDNIPLEISRLKQKEHYFDSILSEYKLTDSSIQNNMLGTINEFASSHNLSVIEFIKLHKIEQNELEINTYKFTIQGSYNEIITLVHQLEQRTKFGEIFNLKFVRKKNYKTGRYYLQAHILISCYA